MDEYQGGRVSIRSRSNSFLKNSTFESASCLATYFVQVQGKWIRCEPRSLVLYHITDCTPWVAAQAHTCLADGVQLAQCVGRVGLVLRALAFHQSGPGSISAPGVICGLSLLVLYSAMRGFPPGTLVFPSHQKPAF